MPAKIIKVVKKSTKSYWLNTGIYTPILSAPFAFVFLCYDNQTKPFFQELLEEILTILHIVVEKAVFLMHLKCLSQPNTQFQHTVRERLILIHGALLPLHTKLIQRYHRYLYQQKTE